MPGMSRLLLTLLLLTAPVSVCAQTGGYPGFEGYTVPADPVAGDAVRLCVCASWPDSCTPYYVDARIQDKDVFLDIYEPWSGLYCAMVITPWEDGADLGALPAGTYDVYVSRLEVMYSPYDGAPLLDRPIPVGDTEYLMTFTVTARQADFNGDGIINAVDLLTFAQSWNTVEGDPDYSPACDLNADGKVNAADLLVLVRQWDRGA